MAYDAQAPRASRTTTKSIAKRPSTPCRASRAPIFDASAVISRA